MPSIKQLQRRLKSVQTTAKITGAMQAVAAMRLRKYNLKASFIARYGQNLQDSLRELFSGVRAIGSITALEARSEGKTLMVIVSPSRGFCGGLHRTVTLEAYKHLKQIGLNPTDQNQVELITVHRPGYRLVTKLGGRILAYFNGPFKELNPYQVLPISELIHRLWNQENQPIIQVLIAYAVPHSSLKATIRIDPMLPLPVPESEQLTEGTPNSNPSTIESDLENFLVEFLPQWLEMKVQLALLQTMAAEEGARMLAMSQASDNAKKIGDKLKIAYFRQRQAKITQEISEIVGGAMS